MAHTQLTLAQRYKISAYLQASISINVIAAYLKVHPSTISREVRRNSLDGKYLPETAEKLVHARRQKAAKVRGISTEVWHVVEKLIKLDYSPEQVAGYLGRSGQKIISHETIYQYIIRDKERGGKLWKHLRWSHRKRRKRYGKNDRRGSIPGRISIDERPSIVDAKSRLGDWEIDTAIGKGHKGVLIVAVERKSKKTLIGCAPYKKADLVANEIIRMLRPFKKHVLTITVDNGKEFSLHQSIARALKADVYFAHPYSAWERGLNENTIGLVRQYFPKNRSFRVIDLEEVAAAQERLNFRPRKILSFKSPNEVFINETAVAFGT